MRSKKMKAREEEIEEEEEVDDEKESQDEEVEDEEESQDQEVEEDKQITVEDSEEQSEIEERKGPKKKKVREKKAEEEEEVEDDEVEDEVREDKQVTDEESEEESKTEGKGKKNGFMSALDLGGPKMKRVREKEEELMEEESEEESETEEKRKKGPKKKKVREKKAEEEEEVEDDEVEDEVREDKQVTDEESEEESKTEGKGKKNGFVSVLDLAGPKMKRVKEKEEEDKQLTEEESEEESETEEERKKGLKRKIEIKRKEEALEGEKSPKKIKIEKQTEKKISNKKISPHLPLDGDDDDDDDDCDDDMELKYDSDGSLIDDDDGKCGVITHPSKCQLSPEEKLKLANLFIQLQHEVLPQHKIEKTAGTRALTKEEKAEFEKYAELRTGKYLPHENKKLRRNWKNFCIANEWNENNPRPFLQMRYKNKVSFIDFKQRMKFIQFLANGLNNRSLYSVFNRFKVLYDPHKVSRYSSSEDDIIIEFIRRYKLSDRERDRKFAELSRILKRTRASVWRRYRVLKRKRKILDDS